MEQHDENIQCQLESWYINFTTINCSSFIVAPSGYYANSCSGSCNSIESSKNITNHARLKQILYGRASDPVKLCCVPKTFLPLYILYYQAQDVLVLRTYREMIVKDCWCQ